MKIFGQFLYLQNLSVMYGSLKALKNVNLKLAFGELCCLLGPSGCGKSTLLRSIAGFTKLETGSIFLDGKTLSSSNSIVAPHERNVGMVFQDLALFPHLNVRKNIDFGIFNLSKYERRMRTDSLLELVGLSGLGERYPHQLSGGQQQRIALARSLAPKPKILLLDEPFSGLDTALRGRLSREMRNILKEDGMTALLVTHDQAEAFDFADRLAVMKNGQIEQCNRVYDVYHSPTTPFVADFVGSGKLIRATVLDGFSVDSPIGVLTSGSRHFFHSGESVKIFLRPDDIVHDDDSEYSALLISKQFRGSYFIYKIQFDSGIQLSCHALSHHNHEVGERVGVRLEIEHLVLFPDRWTG